MSLRTRLVLLLLALATLLAMGEFWLIRTFSQDLRKELETTATTVSRRVVQIFAFQSDDAKEGEVVSPGEPRLVQEDIRIIASPEDPAVEGELPPGHRIRVVTETGPGGEPELRIQGVAGLPPNAGEAPGHGWIQRTEDVRGPGAAAINLPAIPIPTAGLEEAVDRFAGRMLVATLLLLGLSLGLAVWVAHRVTAPLGALVAAAERLGQGDLGTRVPARASGEVGRALVAFNAMSDRLHALDADARALRAREHLSELGEVGRGFAHSLRNPLNALGLAVDELARQEPTAAGVGHARELAGRARRQIRRIDEALRAFLVLGSDGGRAVTAPVELRAVVRDVALELAQSRPEGKETVRVEVVAETSATVDGVEAEIRAALQALVVNAVEASPPGGLVRIELEPQPHGGARLTVDDEGPGLPEEVRRRLFTPHVTTKPAGAGMGLYLAHRIAATRYGGRLDFEDRPTGGTRARLELQGRAREGGGDRG